jgi:hypothetical protein
VQLDNARALVLYHDPASREVVLHPRLHAFAKHWGFRVRACAPYRARTKGKDQRGIGYVKRNAIAGRRFASWAEMEAHLEAWTRDTADQRIHGTTGEEPPMDRFVRDEVRALKPLNGIPRRIEMAFGLARFPFVRDPTGFDFSAQPSIDKAQIREIATGRFIANGEAVLLLGPPEPAS